MDNKKIFESDYLDIIFQGKNKQYGGYVLRKNYTKRAILATVVVLGLFTLLFLLLKFGSSIKAPEEVIDFDKTVQMAEPPPLDEYKPPPPPPPTAPPPVKPTVKFTPPVIKPNEEVRKEDKPEPPKPDENKVVGVENIKGSTDPNAVDPGLTPSGNGTKPAPAPVEPAKKPDNTIHRSVSKRPEFPGSFAKYLQNNLRYPPQAQDQGIEGNIPVEFVVEPDGSISNIKVLKDLGSGLGEEAKRVIRNSPKWIPGEQNGQKVRVYFIQNVTFKLQ